MEKPCQNVQTVTHNPRVQKTETCALYARGYPDPLPGNTAVAEDIETGDIISGATSELLNMGSDSFPSVVILNVGGTLFTTALSTLRRYPDSLLGAMFSGRHTVIRDSHGRPFIDFDPDCFRPILEFLRTETLPPTEQQIELYRAASYFALEPLCARLMATAPVARMLVRVSYRDRFDQYDQFRHHLVKVATEKAALDASHRALVRVLLKPRSPNKADANHSCISANADFDIATFRSGTDAAPGEKSVGACAWDSYEDDLLRCVRRDLISDGFTLPSTVYSREFCAGGCPMSVEKFDFQF